jgi:hypothetical protein
VVFLNLVYGDDDDGDGGGDNGNNNVYYQPNAERTFRFCKKNLTTT